MMLSQLAWIASGGVLIAVLGGITKGLGDIVQFHQRMKILLAVTQATGEEMAKMEDAIRTAAVTTKFFAADMGDAATIMAQAGFSADEIANSIGAVAVLASATGRELKAVADLMTTIIRAYDLNASEAGRVANVLAAGISESKLQIETLTTALNYMGVASHQFGINLEETVAWLGVLRDRGMKASTIGTSFRGVLATLVRETKRFSDVLKNLPTPLGFDDITIRNGRSLAVVMRRLADAGFSVSDAFASIPRRTAMTFSLMIKNVDAFEKLQEKITRTNRAFEMNKITMQGLDSQLKQTKSILDELLLAFTNSGGALEPFVVGIKLIVQVLGSLLIGLGSAITMMSKTLAMAAAIGETAGRSGGPKPGEIPYAGPSTGADWIRNRKPRKSMAAAMKDVSESWLKDIVADAEKAKKSLDRIWGVGEGGNVPSATTLEARERNAKLLDLEKKRTELREKLYAPGLVFGSKEYDKIRDELILVTNQINALNEEILKTGSSIDAIHGALYNFKDFILKTLKDMDAPTAAYMALFRRGADDIAVMEVALEELRNQTAFAVTIKEEGTPEARSRWLKALEAEAAAEKELAKAYKKRSDAEQKHLKDAMTAAAKKVKWVEDNLKKSEKAAKEEVDIQFRNFVEDLRARERDRKEYARFINERESIDQRYFRFKKKLLDDFADLNKDEYEGQIASIENEADRRREVLAQMLTDAIELKKRLEYKSRTSDRYGGELDAVGGRILSLEKQKTVIDMLEKEAKSKIFKPSDYISGMIEGLKEFGKELANEFQTWKDLTNQTAASMRDTMSDVFFDGMTNQLKTAEDYWRSFTNTVKRYIADMAAKWVMFQAFGNMGSGASPSWGLLGAAASSLFPARHSGGRGSGGEAMAVIKNDEFVMRGSSSRNLGYSNLEYMNRTGAMPQQQSTVINNNNFYKVDAIDPQSLDKVLRERGGRAIMDMSLQSFAIGSAKRDPRVSGR